MTVMSDRSWVARKSDSADTSWSRGEIGKFHSFGMLWACIGATVDVYIGVCVCVCITKRLLVV